MPLILPLDYVHPYPPLWSSGYVLIDVLLPALLLAFLVVVVVVVVVVATTFYRPFVLAT